MNRNPSLPDVLLPLLLASLLAACGPTGNGQADPPAAHDATPSDAPSSAAPPADAPPPAAGTDASPRAALLAAHHWRLAAATDAGGNRIDALFVRADAPVQLDFDGDRLAVSNTCNRMAGSYTLDGDRLTIGRMASTLMACADPALGALDAEVGRRLDGTLAIATTAGDAPELVLTHAGGDRLAFAGVPTATTRYGAAPERMFLEVAAQTRPCNHPLIPDMQCLQVRELHYDDNGIETGERGDWQHFYEPIEGYTHAPGVRNVLRVDRYTRTDVPADASRYAYVLDMVVESEQAPR